MHTELCRKEVGSFQESLKGEACVVACTQEAPLFSELARDAGAATALKFINIREHAGWSKESAQATPKIAALLALAELPEPEAVPVVNYRSGGQLLVIGPAEAAIAWAEKLAEQLDVNVLVTRGRGGELPAERRYPVWSGKVKSLKGHLGEFEKPRFFAYHSKICAHSRSSKVGCNQCLDVCSTGAIAPDGDHVKVDPHLCMGCGGCATVCPSGAMTYVYPRVPDLGARLKRVLSVYAQAGGKDACLLLHNAGESRALLAKLARRGKGLPARVIPLEVHHPASIGIDVLLGALAYGAGQVQVLAAPKEAAEYGDAIERQMAYAETIVNALGYGGAHFRLIATDEHAVLEKEIWALAPAASVGKPAAYNLSPEKRTTLEFAIDHLAKQAPKPQQEIGLGAGAPYGQVLVDRQTCTLCMACVGACPESALVDGRDRPMLKFIERNCVQCGLCEKTCPENAITLAPRLLLTPQAKQEVVLNEAEPFNCVRCGKPFGTRQMVDNMLGKLSGHSMFAGDGSLKRLQMCGDCRVVDMMENKNEMTIQDVKK